MLPQQQEQQQQEQRGRPRRRGRAAPRILVGEFAVAVAVVVAVVSVVVVTVLLTSAHAWTTVTRLPTRRSRTAAATTTHRHVPPPLSMIANFFGGGSSSSSTQQPQTAKLPRDIKDAVRQCRAATQQALQQRLSRLTIEFPVGTKFGVEQVGESSTTTKKKSDTNESHTMQVTTLSRDEYDRSNRELARLFVEMFQPVGSDHITVIFETTDLVEAAQQQWNKDDYSGAASSARLLALHRSSSAASKTKNNKKPKAKGFAMKLAQELDLDDNVGDHDSSSAILSASSGPFPLPASTEVALFVAPPDTPKDRQTIARIAESVGMGTLIILLNARWKTMTMSGSVSDHNNNDDTTAAAFESVFCLSAAPQDAAPSCLLYRAYPGPWIVARKAKLGPPQPIVSQSTRPTWDDCQAAYQALEVSELEKGMESLLDNVAGWFR